MDYDVIFDSVFGDIAGATDMPDSQTFQNIGSFDIPESQPSGETSPGGWSGSSLPDGNASSGGGDFISKMISSGEGLLSTKSGQMLAMMALGGISKAGERQSMEDLLKLRSDLDDRQYSKRTALRGSVGNVAGADISGGATGASRSNNAREIILDALAARNKSGLSVAEGGTNTGILAAVQANKRS